MQQFSLLIPQERIKLHFDLELSPVSEPSNNFSYLFKRSFIFLKAAVRLLKYVVLAGFDPIQAQH